MDKEKLAKRYRYLWTGELAAILLFLFLLFFYASREGQWFNWILRTYSVFVVVIILAQSVPWWRWKLRLLQEGRRDMPSHIVSRYARLRGLNWLLIAGFVLAVLAKGLFVDAAIFGPDLWYGLLFLGGAVLEQINYYYYQLMYDSVYDLNHLRSERRLRRGTIAKVLDRRSTG
ncbi:MAG: hypothetical protein ACOC9Z_05785 [Chloroflexota bacterium]